MSTRPENSPRPLSPAQREIMEILWGQGELSAAMVREALPEQRRLARNTVRTMLDRMEEKGWITHRTEGRTFYYSPTLPRTATVGQRVVELVDSLCGGSPETLMTALLEHRGLTQEETDRIRKMLDSHFHSATYHVLKVVHLTNVSPGVINYGCIEISE